MSLAQVIYKISTDSDFASNWARDPEAALDHEGLKLSREEFQFLTNGLEHRGSGSTKVGLADVMSFGRGW